jgi:metal-sulfur cluster biosynthetic enzyme
VSRIVVISPSKEAIYQKLAEVKHPEINCTLVELGMLSDIDSDIDKVTLTMKLPTLGIPLQIKDILLNSVKQAVIDLDTGLETEITLAQMSQEERMKFFSMARANWTG